MFVFLIICFLNLFFSWNSIFLSQQIRQNNILVCFFSGKRSGPLWARGQDLACERKDSHFSSGKFVCSTNALVVHILLGTGNPQNKELSKDKVTCSNPLKNADPASMCNPHAPCQQQIWIIIIPGVAWLHYQGRHHLIIVGTSSISSLD